MCCLPLTVISAWMPGALQLCFPPVHPGYGEALGNGGFPPVFTKLRPLVCFQLSHLYQNSCSSLMDRGTGCNDAFKMVTFGRQTTLRVGGFFMFLTPTNCPLGQYIIVIMTITAFSCAAQTLGCAGLEASRGPAPETLIPPRSKINRAEEGALCSRFLPPLSPGTGSVRTCTVGDFCPEPQAPLCPQTGVGALWTKICILVLLSKAKSHNLRHTGAPNGKCI